MKSNHFAPFFICLLSIWLIQANNWADDTLKSLSVREKIAQMIMIPVYTTNGYNPLDLDFCVAQDIVQQCGVGGIIFMAGSINKQLLAVEQLQQKSSIPLLIGQDGEWGLAMRIEDIKPFPKHMELGGVGDMDTIFSVGKAIGHECKKLGVHTPLAPVVDLHSNPLNPVINNRSFSSDSDVVCQCASYFIKGLQSQKVLACAKHFPGHGDTHVDSHCALPVINKTYAELCSTDLKPFIDMIQKGVDIIMIGHLLVPCLDEKNPATLSRAIVHDFLRNRLQFNGLIITDALRMAALKNNDPILGDIELRALQAGNDILLCPCVCNGDELEAVISYIYDAVCNNEQLKKEVDEHVLRILRCKEQLNLY